MVKQQKYKQWPTISHRSVSFKKVNTPVPGHIKVKGATLTIRVYGEGRGGNRCHACGSEGHYKVDCPRTKHGNTRVTATVAATGRNRGQHPTLPTAAPPSPVAGTQAERRERIRAARGPTHILFQQAATPSISEHEGEMELQEDGSYERPGPWCGGLVGRGQKRPSQRPTTTTTTTTAATTSATTATTTSATTTTATSPPPPPPPHHHHHHHPPPPPTNQPTNTTTTTTTAPTHTHTLQQGRPHLSHQHRQHQGHPDRKGWPGGDWCATTLFWNSRQ